MPSNTRWDGIFTEEFKNLWKLKVLRYIQNMGL